MLGPERKSSKVQLVLMGAALGGVALAEGWPSTDVQRNRYASLDDCVTDYSYAQCNPDAPLNGNSGNGVATHYYYYGPWYRSDFRNRTTSSDPADPGPGRSDRGAHALALSGGHGPVGVEAGSRGGFGSHGRVSARGS
jgi:hypothetical protein